MFGFKRKNEKLSDIIDTLLSFSLVYLQGKISAENNFKREMVEKINSIENNFIDWSSKVNEKFEELEEKIKNKKKE